MVSLVCKPKLHSLVGWMACVDSELPLCIALDTQILGPLCQYVFLHCDVKSLGVCVCVQVSIVQWHKNHLVLHSTEKIFIYSTEHLANMENVYDITIESLIQLVRAKTELELLLYTLYAESWCLCSISKNSFALIASSRFYLCKIALTFKKKGRGKSQRNSAFCSCGLGVGSFDRTDDKHLRKNRRW